MVQALRAAWGDTYADLRFKPLQSRHVVQTGHRPQGLFPGLKKF